ncbi:MAG TPA: gamma-glutamyltransferase, partial [Ilumatobacteraceae bacterium]|nr:gamma-glutamyltransferase [Ilumatobacteraceae bacterium]
MSAAIATSDPRASAAGADVLRAGGNAVDAAATAAFVLYVVEPQSCGIGGDAFMLIHDGSGPPLGLDGSGLVPVGLTRAALEADGLDNVPARGAKTATPPGAVALLAHALAGHGTISLAEAIAPALRFAADGFAVRPSLADAARRATAELADQPVLGPLYWPGGVPVGVDDIVVNHDLASALRVVAAQGGQALTTGSLAVAIVEAIEAQGGYLTSADLAAHRTTSITPESVEFAGHRVWQMPAPTQGPAVLEALAALSSTEPVDWEAAYRAVASGMAAAGFDPAAVRVGTPSPAKGDTTFIAAVDRDGVGVSLITSVFGDFGSHLGIRALGGPIHNRATTFRLSTRPIQPGKPPHTTIPGMITNADGSLAYVMGVAGGVMQPQAQ